MPLGYIGFTFTTQTNPVCWTGSPTYFELQLLQPLPNYALEQLRLRFLNVLTTNHNFQKSARVVVQMAFETEVGVAIVKSISPSSDISASTVCERRSYIDVDTDMQPYSFLVNAAFGQAALMGFLPPEYLTLIRSHTEKQYAKYRMSAVAALLCIATKYLIPEVKRDFTQTAADTATVVDTTFVGRGFYRYRADTATAVDARVYVVGHILDPKADTVTTADAKALLWGYQQSVPEGLTVFDIVLVEKNP